MRRLLRRALLVAFAVFVLTIRANATLYTTTATGNWSDTTKWTPTPPAGGPTAGDTAILAHAMTYDPFSGSIGRAAGTSLAGTGTINTVTNTTAVVGTGTAFTTQLNVGDMFIGAGSFAVVITAIADDTHLTVGSAITVANGAAFTYTPAAIYIKSTGTLTLAAGVVLTVRGDLPVTGTGTYSDRLILNAGSTLEIDASTSPSPTTCFYLIRLSTTHIQYPKLRCNGTSDLPCMIRSKAGGGNSAIVSGGWIGGANINATWTTFQRLGNSVNTSGIDFYPTSNIPSELTLANCTFDAVQNVKFSTNMGALTNVSLTSCTWMNTPAGFSCLTTSVNAGGTGTRLVNDCTFDRVVGFNTWAGFTLTNNRFLGNLVPSSTASPALFQYNLVLFSATSNSQAILGNWLNSYYLYDTYTDNPHGLATGDTDCTIDGVVFDCTNMDGNGDMVLPTSPSVLRQVVVKRCFVLPNMTGWAPGELVSPIGNNFQYTVEHNTVTTSNTNENGIAVYGETYTGRADLYTSVRANISYTLRGKGPAPKFMRHNTSTVGDVVSVDATGAVKLNYNAANNPVKTVAGQYKAIFGFGGGYVDIMTSPTVPMFTVTTGIGRGDVEGDPDFVDPTRNFATFDSMYLGNRSPAWLPSHGYSLGSTVSVSGQSTMYGGARINFRCINAHTSSSVAGDSALGRPGNLRSQQTVTFTGTAPTSGTFTLPYYSSNGSLGAITSTLQWNATAATIASAVQTAAATAGDSITVTGSGGPFNTTPVQLTYTVGGNPFLTIGVARVIPNSLSAGATLVVPTWRSNWEFASYEPLRQTGLVYSPLRRQATVRDLLYWVYNGFRPRNPAYRNGTYPGDPMQTDALGLPMNGTFGAVGHQLPRSNRRGLRPAG